MIFNLSSRFESDFCVKYIIADLIVECYILFNIIRIFSAQYVVNS